MVEDFLREFGLESDESVRGFLNGLAEAGVSPEIFRDNLVELKCSAAAWSKGMSVYHAKVDRLARARAVRTGKAQQRAELASMLLEGNGVARLLKVATPRQASIIRQLASTVAKQEIK